MLIKEIRLQNLLSFGPNTPPLELRPLNVLIGPNGSGKSNLIEAISLLQAAPKDLSEPAIRGGGAKEWIWKGAANEVRAHITTRSAIFGGHVDIDVIHQMQLSPMRGEGLGVLGESLKEVDNRQGTSTVVYESKYSKGRIKTNGEFVDIELSEREGHHSILSLRRDPQYYRAITNLSLDFSRIRIYRDWCFGRTSATRVPQSAFDLGDFLNEDLSNLALTLSTMLREPGLEDRLLVYLQKFSPSIRKIGIDNILGTVQVYLHEESYRISAMRLSDGTMRFICLIAILCHPSPPPLICIEEPEIGLHPDVLPTIAELLREASTRTQLIVTTHSDILIDALTDTPEDVVVCEKHDGCTTMKRLNKDDLAIWLEKYSLGNLWTSGQIGGNRF